MLPDQPEQRSPRFLAIQHQHVSVRICYLRTQHCMYRLKMVSHVKQTTTPNSKARSASVPSNPSRHAHSVTIASASSGHSLRSGSRLLHLAFRICLCRLSVAPFAHTWVPVRADLLHTRSFEQAVHIQATRNHYGMPERQRRSTYSTLK